MKHILIATLLLSPLLLAPAISQARVTNHRASALFPVTLTDDHGNRVHLRRLPRRIISLDPRDTETLFALGLEKRVVADGGKYDEGATGIVNAAGKPRDFRYPSEWPSKWGRDYPIKSLALAHIEGGCCGVDFNLETIASLQPDLVIGPFSETELPVYQKMRDLGLHVMILDPANLKGILHDLTLVGRATGAVARARTVTAQMQKVLASVKKAVMRVRSRPRVYYELDDSKPTTPVTAGPGTFIDEAIRVAGGKNIADAVSSCSGTLCYPSFSLEALVQQNPQIIIYSIYEKLYGSVTVAGIKSRGGWDTMSAVKGNRVFTFNDDLLSRAGPRTALGVRNLAKLIHPALFKKR
ncbi:MAG: ABC transporter substrate-binding protein [Chloroflexota bacterium]